MLFLPIKHICTHTLFLSTKWKLLIVLLSVVFRAQSDFVAKFLKLANVDVYFNIGLVSLYGSTRGSCLFACLNTIDCVYFSYYSVQKLCSLHDKNVEILSGTTGGELYFKLTDKTGETGFDFMTGARAFQSSTLRGFSASRAMDGNTNGIIYDGSCSHTGLETNPYWIMQLGEPGVIGKVDIYLRSDYIQRNTNRSVMVSQSYDGAVNNVGIECGRYMGPLIVEPPHLLTIRCVPPIFGKYLRITMISQGHLEICEVIVYSL